VRDGAVSSDEQPAVTTRMAMTMTATRDRRITVGAYGDPVHAVTGKSTVAP
jgi:hypothetical protein